MYFKLLNSFNPEWSSTNIFVRDEFREHLKWKKLYRIIIERKIGERVKL